MCLLTMLLRLRQATDHVDLLKGKLEEDKDALNDNKSPESKFVEEDDLVNMMSGLGIESKCTICFTMYALPAIWTTVNVLALQLEEKDVTNVRRILKLFRLLKLRLEGHHHLKFDECWKSLKLPSMTIKQSKQLSFLNLLPC